MKYMLIKNLIFSLFLCLGILFPVYGEMMIIDEDNPSLTILTKTDRGYYAPGEVIRVKGEVTGEDGVTVPAELLFHFQGMNKTAQAGPDGEFLVSVPISLVEPENLYRLVISAQADGYLEKNVSIPIVIMGEPSSLAPVPAIPDEFTPSST